MYLQHWGSSHAEVLTPMVGDDLVPDARLVATRAIDLAAPPRLVWPWLVQMGFGRGGWYSYDGLDNLGRPSAARIHPEWQHLVAGSAVPAGPIAFRATVVDAPHALVLEVRRRARSAAVWPSRSPTSCAPAGRLPRAARPRLVTRVRARIDLPFGRFIERYVLGPSDGIMLRKQLLNLARRTALDAGPATSAGRSGPTPTIGRGR